MEIISAGIEKNSGFSMISERQQPSGGVLEDGGGAACGKAWLVREAAPESAVHYGEDEGRLRAGHATVEGSL